MNETIPATTPAERALLTQVERLDVLNAKLALSADKERARRVKAEDVLENLRAAMASTFGVTFEIREERE
jgi:hypothetical protein